MRRPWPGWLPREAWTTDIGVTLLVQAAITMPFVVPRSASLPPATWAAYGLTTLTVLPLAVRRRAPVSVLIAVLSAGALYRFTVDGPGQPLPYTGLVAFYTVAELSSPRRRLAVSLLVTAAVVPSVAVNTGEARELLFSLFVFAAAYAFGRFTHTRKAYIRAMEDRARQREVTHRIEAEQAAARERARIAREMHDILSHAVSLMIVQAEAGPVAVRTAPERAEAAFDAISETGRDAMVQLRRMLGVLREDAPGGRGAAAYAPAGTVRAAGPAGPGSLRRSRRHAHGDGPAGRPAGGHGGHGVPDRAGGADERRTARRCEPCDRGTRPHAGPADGHRDGRRQGAGHDHRPGTGRYP